MRKAIETICFMSWLLCACSIDQVCDDWRACVVFVIALIVVIAAAAAITRNDQ